MFCELCDYITVPFIGAKKAYYKEFFHKIKVIPQGFQFEINQKVNIPKNEKITFAYSGTFLKDIRNPTNFFDYLCEVDIDFKFYVYTPYIDLIKSYKKKLGNKLIIKKLIPRSELINKLKQMDFLVNIENLNTSSQLPSKLIDYSISRSPILSVNPNQLNKKIINQFLNRNFINQLKVKNLENYHISNVAKSFLNLSRIK